MYADDLVIRCPSLIGLQRMVDIYTAFNATKTVNVAVGNKRFSMPNVFFIDGNATPSWVCSLIYLGVRFNACNTLEVDSSSINRRFYTLYIYVTDQM